MEKLLEIILYISITGDERTSQPFCFVIYHNIYKLLVFHQRLY